MGQYTHITRWGRSLWVAVAFTLGASATAWGHGAIIQAQPQTGVLLVATFETGEPMANAQVQVYGPEDPRTPRWVGTTDAEGRYFLLPDRAGEWAVAVRQAGHGTITEISVDEASVVTLAAPGPGTLSPWQRGLMAAAVTWGCVGTALFLRGDRRPQPSARPTPDSAGGQG